MAIWQFALFALPRKGVLERFGHLPESLHMDYKERTEHYHLKEEDLVETGDFFEDALLQDWWSSTLLQPTEIIHQIDKRVRRAAYGDDTFIQWKFNNGQVDNDAYLSIHETTGKIEGLQFRADLREENLVFLKAMIDLAQQYDWMLMDFKGNLVEPRFEEVKKLIRRSNAYAFLKDPIKFFESLDRDSPPT